MTTTTKPKPPAPAVDWTETAQDTGQVYEAEVRAFAEWRAAQRQVMEEYQNGA